MDSSSSAGRSVARHCFIKGGQDFMLVGINAIYTTPNRVRSGCFLLGTALHVCSVHPKNKNVRILVTALPRIIETIILATFLGRSYEVGPILSELIVPRLRLSLQTPAQQPLTTKVASRSDIRGNQSIHPSKVKSRNQHSPIVPPSSQAPLQLQAIYRPPLQPITLP
ncbi:unnamed protein product [Periconia digitata]|uniref:Uncharacterized protein n=1 Tax=Periconia digitata TaxID=1303443 RepID=A0A9W4U6C1_9PLEO|nr:unnamed protein product [Periconia digitata]